MNLTRFSLPEMVPMNSHFEPVHLHKSQSARRNGLPQDHGSLTSQSPEATTPEPEGSVEGGVATCQPLEDLRLTKQCRIGSGSPC